MDGEEWEELWTGYSMRDLQVGHTVMGDGPLEDEIEAWKADIRARDARRIPPGFQIPPPAETKKRRKRR